MARGRKSKAAVDAAATTVTEEQRRPENEIEEESDEELEEEEELWPKLPEGYYEIEAIRNKRSRKGEPQYLIKWRNWPESANTWEPLDNLHHCMDDVEAFDESMRSGEHRGSRKRRRKSGAWSSQTKKRRPSSPNGPAGRVRLIEEPFVSPSPDVAINAGGVHNVGVAEQENGSESVTVSAQVESKEQTEIHISFVESNGVAVEGNMEQLASNGQSKTDEEESVASGCRVGAKRRKPALVTRFKRDESLCVTNYAEHDAPKRNTRFRAGQQHDENHDSKDKIININHAKAIKEIVKPLAFTPSESNNAQGISVTFKATRGDGEEVVVDNKFLKIQNPLLLIDFYERHLKYSVLNC